MFDDQVTYIPLGALATRLGLPQSYLKTLADKRAIPSLNVKGRLRFNPLQVQEALDRVAAEQRAQGQTDER